MEKYIHRVQYYETDKMGFTHHSNYVRWMEEARVDLLSQIGYDYARLEEMGIVSPVTAVACRYRASTSFPDEVTVAVAVKELKGVRLTLDYEMVREADGKLVCTAESEHCFMDREGRVISLKREYPDFYNALLALSPGE